MATHAPQHELLPDKMTVAQARRSLSGLLQQGGIESAEIDARLLIGHVLALDHSGLASRHDHQIESDDIARINALAVRRLANEPVARIIGSKEFWSLPLRVTPAVLVPRPETETIVEFALASITQAGLRTEKLRILDIGTGSGALLLALLSELPNTEGTGSDISVEALAVARENARALGLDTRSTFVTTSFADALAGPFDLIVSNPPYIPHGDIATLAADVRVYDPHLALDGGPDGLACYRAIVGDAPRILAPKGRLMLELGAGQAGAVASLIDAGGRFRPATTRPDLAGIPRALTATLAS